MTEPLANAAGTRRAPDVDGVGLTLAQNEASSWGLQPTRVAKRRRLL